MIGLFLALLLASSVAPAFMPTKLAFRRAIGCFMIIAIAVFFGSLGTFGKISYGLGGPEALILGGVLSLVLLTISCTLRLVIFRREARKQVASDA